MIKLISTAIYFAGIKTYKLKEKISKDKHRTVFRMTLFYSFLCTEANFGNLLQKCFDTDGILKESHMPLRSVATLSAAWAMFCFLQICSNKNLCSTCFLDGSSVLQKWLKVLPTSHGCVDALEDIVLFKIKNILNVLLL